VVTDRIEREIRIDAPQERVWAVLTEAEHVAGWFGDTAELDLRPDGKAAFGWEGSTFHAVLERVEPPSFFSYRWARKAGEQPADGNATLVEFTLSSRGSGTLLTVVETGFASLLVTEQEQAEAAEENTKGWASELAELQEYAERPGA
jgi:uncharacterized protein YndB with AHSA1/START domain